MRNAPTTCHGLTTPLFLILLGIYCCDSHLEHSSWQDESWLSRIERRWEANVGGHTFAITFCEDARAWDSAPIDGCSIDHVVHSGWFGHGNTSARGCGGCELDVLALTTVLVTTEDGQLHAIRDGQFHLGTAYDDRLDNNDFTFSCRDDIWQRSDWDGDDAPDMALTDLSCELLDGVQNLPNGALAIRGQTLRELGYASVNVPLLRIFDSTSAVDTCAEWRKNKSNQTNSDEQTNSTNQ
ncbi:MAG: hypothetical protein IKC51_03650 [Myxococcaceae bacterium]|nr:hypothetical protein [Myxococcaceae bacterium]